MKAKRIALTVGASRIRKILLEMEGEERLNFISLIWPDIHPDFLRMISQYPEETTINGSQLLLPLSWDMFIGDNV